MNEMLRRLTVGELCTELHRRMLPNAEIKITPRKIRVQHNIHCDNLMSVEAVDNAWRSNISYRVA